MEMTLEALEHRVSSEDPIRVVDGWKFDVGIENSYVIALPLAAAPFLVG